MRTTQVTVSRALSTTAANADAAARRCCRRRNCLPHFVVDDAGAALAAVNVALLSRTLDAGALCEPQPFTDAHYNLARLGSKCVSVNAASDFCTFYACMARIMPCAIARPLR